MLAQLSMLSRIILNSARIKLNYRCFDRQAQLANFVKAEWNNCFKTIVALRMLVYYIYYIVLHFLLSTTLH